MKSRSKPQVIKSNGQLLPLTQYDAEQLEDYKDGQVFNVSSTGKRSNPHHNLYWSILRSVCRSTGKWPTERQLHNELKFACGYWSIHYSSISGTFLRLPDSISFDQMSQEEFNQYFEMAMAKLAEAVGYDPTHEQFS